MQPRLPGSSILGSPTRPTWRTKLPFFYGWVVVGSVFAILVITMGIYYSFSVFFVALLHDFGWGRAETAGVYSLFAFMVGVGGAPAGPLVDRLGPSRVVPVGGAILAVGLIAASQASELWQLYLYFGFVAGLGISVSGWIPGITAISRWFSHRRGLAVGIASAGIGVGTVVVAPVSQYLISQFGWRSALILLAAVVLLGIVPQSALLLVGSPEELGMEPDGVGNSSSPGGKSTTSHRIEVVDEEWNARRWSVGAALRTSRFWFLGATIVGVTTCNQTLWLHQAAFLVDSGFDKMLAASVVGLVGLVSIPWKPGWGALGDRLGREWTYTVGLSIVIVAILSLSASRLLGLPWLAFLFAIGFGSGYAAHAPTLPTAVADIFGRRNYGAIYGVLNIAMGLGGSFGPWWAGFIFDLTGSYYVAFATAALAAAISVTSLWLAAPRKVRRIGRGGG